MSRSGKRHDRLGEECDPPSKGRVLLVHETLSSLAYNYAILHKIGFDVTACAFFKEGLLTLDAGPWKFIIVSQGGPAFESKGLLERALKAYPRTPVIVLARCHDMSSYLEAMKLGAEDYLEEPLSLAQMQRVLEARPRATNGPVPSGSAHQALKARGRNLQPSPEGVAGGSFSTEPTKAGAEHRLLKVPLR